MSIIGRIHAFKLVKTSPLITVQSSSFSTVKRSFFNKKTLYTGIGIAASSLGILIYSLDKSVHAYTWELHPPNFGWGHYTYLKALDHASIRRGYEVYKNVCSACHSMEHVPFRRMVGVCYTEEEAKALAAEVQIKDGPDETGEYFMRPGRLMDYFPSPYPNEEAAAYANNGAVPPDLSLIVLARHGNEDYVMSLLTGYTDPPAGVVLAENAHYNPYKYSSVLAMAPPLYNGVIEYSDGTPATLSQLAKDVTTFLIWASQPEYDKRMLYTIKGIVMGIVIIPPVWWLFRHRWNPIKTRKIMQYHSSKK